MWGQRTCGVTALKQSLFALYTGVFGGRVERDFFSDNLLVRINFIIVMIRWTGLAPWEFEFLFQVALHLPS